MSSILEVLWRPREKDLLTGMRQQIRNVRYTQSSAAATVTAGEGTATQVPPDTVRYIERVTVWAQGGGAQTVVRADCTVRYITGGTFYYARKRPLIATPADDTFDFPLGILLLPGTYVSCSAEFSAGAVANDINVSLIGWEMPRGNFA